MSLACTLCRSRLYAIAAGRADDATRLEAETHLGGCATCREERARWQVIGQLSGYEPSLSSQARDRVRASVLLSARVEPKPAPAPMRSFRYAALAFAALAVVVTGSFGMSASRESRDPARVVAGDIFLDGKAARSGTAIGDSATLSAGKAGGEVTLDGPQVALHGATIGQWSRAERTLRLDAGEVDVRVDPGQGRRFRVSTPRFTAEVVGTRFTVTLRGVSTERGKVRVLSPDGQQLALVGAGQHYTVPDEVPSAGTASAPSSSRRVDGLGEAAVAAVAPAAIVPAMALGNAPLPPASTVAGRGVVNPNTSGPGTQLVEEARHAVSRGEAERARALLREANGQHLRPALAAEAASVMVESYLVEGRKDEAISAYHDLARDHAHRPQAESALFAIGQLELELGRREAAQTSFGDYLARFPHGRFRAEAQAGLGRSTAPRP